MTVLLIYTLSPSPIYLHWDKNVWEIEFIPVFKSAG